MVAVAKHIGVDATVAAFLSELGWYFRVKQEQEARVYFQALTVLPNRYDKSTLNVINKEFVQYPSSFCFNLKKKKTGFFKQYHQDIV